MKPPDTASQHGMWFICNARTSAVFYSCNAARMDVGCELRACIVIRTARDTPHLWPSTVPVTQQQHCRSTLPQQHGGDSGGDGGKAGATHAAATRRRGGGGAGTSVEHL